MLLEQTFLREDVCARQGSYLKSGNLLALQNAMDNLWQFPMKNFWGCNGASADQGCPPPLRWKTHVAYTHSIPNNYNTTPSLVAQGLANNEKRESKATVDRTYTKTDQYVSAFGPQHAEHARRLYLSKRSEHEISPVLAPYYKQHYGPMHVEHYEQIQVKNVPNFVWKSAYGRAPFYSGYGIDQLPFHIGSKTRETVLKVAKISPRPGPKQRLKLNRSLRLGEKQKDKVDQGLVKKSSKSREYERETYLANAPLFQILCEISKS